MRVAGLLAIPLGILTLAMLVTVAVVASVPDTRGAAEPLDRWRESGSWLLAQPDRWSPSVRVWSTKDARDDCNAAHANPGAWKSVCAAGVIAQEPPDRKIEPLEFGDMVRVRLLDGPNQGLVGWVLADQIENG